jgi:hypothetical protein
MEQEKYYIKISPESISEDIFKVCYPSGATFNSGCTYVYSSMTDLLSGGTYNQTTGKHDSLLTGLTIPIVFTETAVDIGYYSVFDGAIMQSDVVKNFVFSSTTSLPYTYYFYNTSEHELKNYLQLSSYNIDWGDGSSGAITTFSPNYQSHNYFNPGEYTITLSQTNPWGINTIKKTIVVPFTGTTIPNPNGTAYFTSNVGSWSATPISYDFIFSGDAENTISGQTGSTFTSVPFIVSGYTSSRLSELEKYGIPKYDTNWVQKNGVNWGKVITNVNVPIPLIYTAYTIEDVSYIDYSGGTTVYVLQSYGLTSNWLVAEPITKEEILLNIIYQPEVQSDIYIERGKNSATERAERLGEVDNLGDLVNYGYGFFKVVTQ